MLADSMLPGNLSCEAERPKVPDLSWSCTQAVQELRSAAKVTCGHRLGPCVQGTCEQQGQADMAASAHVGHWSQTSPVLEPCHAHPACHGWDCSNILEFRVADPSLDPSGARMLPASFRGSSAGQGLHQAGRLSGAQGKNCIQAHVRPCRLSAVRRGRHQPPTHVQRSAGYLQWASGRRIRYT